MRRLISSGSRFEAEGGYSRAVVDGEWVFVAGTTGFDYAQMTIAEDPAKQARQALRGGTHRRVNDRLHCGVNYVGGSRPMPFGISIADPKTAVRCSRRASAAFDFLAAGKQLLRADVGKTR